MIIGLLKDCPVGLVKFGLCELTLEEAGCAVLHCDRARCICVWFSEY